MDRNLRQQVWSRANSCCEYCQMPQQYAEPSHEVDHIIAEKHAGKTELENLACACFHCNNHKGPNIAGLDPDTRALTRIFDPRHDSWKEHFTWDGVYLVGNGELEGTQYIVEEEIGID